jgi:hypothetical protein
VFSEASEFIRIKSEKTNHKRGNQDYGESRKDPPNSSGIEVGETEGIIREAIPNNPADQKPRDNEEDINTDEPPGQNGGEYVVQDHTGDRYGTKAIDVTAVLREGKAVSCRCLLRTSVMYWRHGPVRLMAIVG